MIVDFEQNEVYPEWAAKRLDIEREYFGNCTTIAVWNNNNLVAVAVYSSFNGINCEITIAANSKWWVRRDLINVLLKYPYEQLGCKRTTLLIRECNEPVIRLAEKLGYEREGSLRRFYQDGANCLIYGLLSDRIH